MTEKLQDTGSEPTELLLSILVAVSVGFALERLLSQDDFLWFCLSVIAILISVGFIYVMLETTKYSFKSVSRVLVILSVIFFPFTLAKATQNSISSIFDWSFNKEIVYGVLMGVCFVAWGIAEYREKNKSKGIGIIVFGGTIIAFSLLFGVLLVGGILKI